MTDSVTLRPDPQAASRIEFTALRDDGESTLSIVVDADGGWRLSETDECARSGTISTGCLHDLIVGFLSAFGIEDEMTLELTEIRGSWFVRFLRACPFPRSPVRSFPKRSRHTGRSTAC